MSSNIAFVNPLVNTSELTNKQLEFVEEIIIRFISINKKSDGKYPIGWNLKQLVIVKKRIVLEWGVRKKEGVI